MKKIIYKLQNRFMRTCYNDINYDTLQKMLNNNSNIVLIDVRTKDEFQYNHLNGAINIPVHDFSEALIKKKINNKNTVIIVYCEYGGRSKKAVKKLIKMGYNNVYNLDGGIDGI